MKLRPEEITLDTEIRLDAGTTITIREAYARGHSPLWVGGALEALGLAPFAKTAARLGELARVVDPDFGRAPSPSRSDAA